MRSKLAASRDRVRVLFLLLVASVFGSAVAGAEEKPKRAGSRWAILVGVNDYTELADLQYSANDVSALRDQLIASGFPKDQVFLLHDKAEQSQYLPMKRNIEKQLQLVLGLLEKDDLVVLAFSGHGVQLDAKNYFCPADAGLDDPEQSLISIDKVYQQLQQSQAAMKVVLIDACRNDPRVGGTKEAKAARDASTSFLNSLERPPQGILLLTSCAAGEVSKEDKELRHGVFMHYVLEGLKGQADADKSGSVSLSELWKFANRETKVYVAHKFNDSQRPGLKGDIEDDFDFGTIVAPRTFTNSIGMELVLIPAGEFVMGSPESEEGRLRDEQQHRVRITQPFFLGKHEVTQAEYQAVMGKNPSRFQGDEERVKGGDTSRFPVEKVSWDDAIEFCRRLSAKESKSYRLPTEAEWEYACRTGTTTPFHSSSVANGGEANVNGTIPYGAAMSGTYLKRTTQVGSYHSNIWGLFDMHGNVSEWCADWYDRDYYANSPDTDPSGPTSGSARVIRGGGWYDLPHYCRSAARLGFSPDLRSDGIGFRVVLLSAVSR